MHETIKFMAEETDPMTYAMAEMGLGPERLVREIWEWPRKIETLFREAVKATGVKAGHYKVLQMPPGPNPLAFGINDTTLDYAAGFGRFFTDAQIQGIMAHELGHVYYRDFEKPSGGNPVEVMLMQEKRADKFAGERGWAVELIGAFEIMESLSKNSALQEGPKTHPDSKDRIQMLKQYIGVPKNKVCPDPPCLYLKEKEARYHVQAAR